MGTMLSRRLSDVTRRGDPFVVTLGLAAALHVALLGWRLGPAASGLRPDVADLEVDVVAWDPGAADQRVRLPSEPEELHAPARALPRSVAVAVPTEQLAPGEAPTVPPADPVPGFTSPVAPGAAGGKAGPTRPAVRLYLGAADLKALVGPSPTAEQGPANSATLFGAHSGAEVAASPSSPAVSAGYRAAQLGPRVGTAVVEVHTSAQGSVTAVYLVGDDESGLWSAVVADLLGRLGHSVLRLPAGAKGMITRLRIDRGYLAEDLAVRGKVERGVALGQDHHPKDLSWEESTQGSMRSGRLAPTAGVSSESLRTSVPTRILLLSQQFL